MDSGFSNRDGNPRKRARMSRNTARHVRAASGVNAYSAIAGLATASAADRACAIPQAECHHGQTLKTLHTDIDAMRTLVTCQVCYRLMYEPYALSCGHTYCYGCLTHWLTAKKSSNCPDCRTVIASQPHPSYIIRELVLIFISRSELLPDGETLEEHNATARDEADIVTKHKADTDHRTGGLFKGAFKRKGHGPLKPLVDPSDGVERCPECHWEIEDGWCNQCDVPVGAGDGTGFSDDDGDSITTDDDEDEDLDHDIDELDADFGIDGDFGVDGEDFRSANLHDSLSIPRPDDPDWEDFLDSVTAGRPYRAHLGPIRRPTNRISSSTSGPSARRPVLIDSEHSGEDSEDDDGRDDTLGGFIEDDGAESDATEVQDVPRPRRARRGAPVIISDDDDEDDDDDTVHTTQPEVISVADSEDGGSASTFNHRSSGTLATSVHRSVANSSDDDSSEGEGIVTRAGASRGASFSPLDGSVARSGSHYDGDEDSEATSSARPALEFLEAQPREEYDYEVEDSGDDEEDIDDDDLDAEEDDDDDDDDENGNDWGSTAIRRNTTFPPTRRSLAATFQQSRRHTDGPISRTMHQALPSTARRNGPSSTSVRPSLRSNRNSSLSTGGSSRTAPQDFSRFARASTLFDSTRDSDAQLDTGRRRRGRP